MGGGSGARAWLLAIALGASCGDEKDESLEELDAATARDDAGEPPGDAGPSDGMLAPPPSDGAMPPSDSGAPDAQPSDPDAGPPPPPPPVEPGPPIGTFELTYYWVACEGDHPDGAPTALYEEGCAVLATVPADFADAIALEGTGRLLDGRMLNVSGSCGCALSPCFFVLDADHPWGVGVGNRPLVPFRSIAIDRSVLDIGTGYYVEELDGLLVPGEAPWGDFAHDGCVTADDVGGGIRGMHIDFFAALREHYRTLVAEVGTDFVTVHQGGARCSP